MSTPLTIADSWAAIHQYLKKHEPATCQQFEASCGPVTQPELASIEAGLGVPLAADLKESLLLHNLRVELPVLGVFGYANSAQAMFSQYRVFLQGPLMTRFSDTQMQDPTQFRGGLYGCMPLSTYDQDRTYFYLMIDIIGGCVFYLDFGDLVGDPSGQILTWDFRTYLSTIARLLQSVSTSDFVPFHRRWPEMQFGFNGIREILNAFPAKRKLVIPGSGFMEELPDYQNVVLREAYANPTTNFADPLPVALIPPEIIPAGLPDGVTFLSNLTWDIAGIDPPPLLVSEDRKTVRIQWMRGEGITSEQFLDPPGIYMFEVRVVAAMSVGIGIVSRKPNDESTSVSVATEGRALSICQRSMGPRGTGTSSCTLQHFEGQEQLMAGEILGILLDLSHPQNRMISVYRNRRVVSSNIRLESDFVPLTQYLRFKVYCTLNQAEVSFVSFEKRLRALTGKKRSRSDVAVVDEKVAMDDESSGEKE